MELVEEPRSFAPTDERRVRTTPIDVNHATMRALARGHNQLHECLEGARNDIVEVDAKVVDVKADVAEIKKALGLGERPKKVAGLASTWQSFRRTVLATSTSITALAVLWVAARYIAWPMLVAGWEAFEHMARAGGI